MNKNKLCRLTSLFLVFAFLSSIFILMGGIQKVNAQSNNFCSSHPNKMWAWSLDGAWMSTNKTGDWKTDNWFYLLKSGEPVVVLQIDSASGYYLVCYDFGSSYGWEPLYGWVYKDNILLQSQITPAP